jgi:hypothetical protein
VKTIRLFVLFCVACGKPTPAPVTPAAAPVREAVATPDASVDAEPPAPARPAPPTLGPPVAGSASCSAGDLGATGNPRAMRRLPDDCYAKWDAIEKIDSPARVLAQHDRSLSAIETSSAKEFAKLVSCPLAVDINWSREHLWVVIYEAEDGGVTVGSVIDDGNVAVIGANAWRSDRCGGAAPSSREAFALAVVPAGRAVAIGECTSTEPPSHCTGLYK